MENPNGYITLFLHTHLPYVNHPENDNYIEERWLYEAISETYIPLLKYFNKLVEEKVNFRITMSITPPLLYLLDSEVQKEKYKRYLESHIELSKKEIERTQNFDSKVNELARYYFKKYSEDLYVFTKLYNCDIIAQFKALQDVGVLEIVTGCATHGFIPMLCTNEKDIEIQIKYGIMAYEKYFKRKPRGMWLSECGYVPEVEKYLKKYGIEYFLTEMHGLIYAKPVPIYGVYAPIATQNGLVAFGRNVASTMKIWSNTTGYPGDYNYRDFGRDIGFDLDYDYIKPYITYDGIRIPTGIKYYSVSGKQDEKEYYDLQKAKEMAEIHAYDYMQTTINQIQEARKYMKNKIPLIVSMQDTELYGHWWYEGPYWLYILIKKIYYDQEKIDFITPGEYIDKYPEMQICQVAISTWGAGGTNAPWLRCEPAEIYLQLDNLSCRMNELANKYQNEINCLKIKALNQCARELLLLQSSDWYFNLTCHRVEEYSYKRINTHIERFNKLDNQIENNNIDLEFLECIEFEDNIFPEIDFKDYSVIY